MRRDITPGMIKKAEELDEYTKKRIAYLWTYGVGIQKIGKRLDVSYLVVRAYLELSGHWNSECYHGRAEKGHHNEWLTKGEKHSEIYSR